MRIMLVIMLLSITAAHAATIDLDQFLTFTLTATQADYEVMGYDTQTGSWTISIRLRLQNPLLEQQEPRFTAHTHYQCVVTAEELAAYLQTAIGTVSENFTGKQINDAVAAIAYVKTLAAYGIQLPE